MPTAGDEGYEKLVRCPYDKSHEIRKGRMQFHLEKCRRNFPMSQLEDCPLNNVHKIPKQELQYHMEEECDGRSTWDRYSTDVAAADCPVKDLVPVNAATVPDGEESWDNFEASGSVLNKIRCDVESKPVVRMLQVASKAQRKKFRLQERQRHSKILEETQGSKPSEITLLENKPSLEKLTKEPPRRVCGVQKPQIQSNVTVDKQDPTIAVVNVSKLLNNMDLNTKPKTGSKAPSDTSSVVCPSEYESASSSYQVPPSYATASSLGRGKRPESSLSNLSTDYMTTLGSSHRAPNSNISRPSTAMSNVTSHNSYATASQGASNRPSSAMSNSSTLSSASALTDRRPPNSSTSRQSTAMNIAASVGNNLASPDEEGFCRIPIPGLGRGRRGRIS